MTWTDWAAHTIYRHLPPDPTHDNPNSSPSTSSQTSHVVSSATSLGSSSDGNTSNQAWIAGAVIGPLAAVAATLFVIWWWRRKIKKKQRQTRGGEGSFIPGLLLVPDKTESDRGTMWSHHAPSDHTSVARSNSHGRYQRQSVPRSTPSPGFVVPDHSSLYRNARSPPPRHARDAAASELSPELHGQGHAAWELAGRTRATQLRPGYGEGKMPPLSELPALPQ
ncbi:hypothetical protein ACRALDRAFT_1082899 [Sodiomyces alcalophilus JCM 7366]|uniref:uncharacterized protein n=1 Tax=Sodiomyces alcalophilus JCM 7366 TaxID=591952 RepID=UPI0039B679A1